MATQDDGAQTSRVPTLEDLIKLCRDLNQRKAKYIVIGGMAIVHHGFIRATQDIDLLVETSKENEKLVIDALSRLPDSASEELKPGDINQYEVVRVADEIVIDLMKKACGIDYQEASKDILRVTLEGVEIPFASIDLMIRLKQGVRPQDQMDLAFLRQLKKGS